MMTPRILPRLTLWGLHNLMSANSPSGGPPLSTPFPYHPFAPQILTTIRQFRGTSEPLYLAAIISPLILLQPRQFGRHGNTVPLYQMLDVIVFISSFSEL